MDPRAGASQAGAPTITQSVLAVLTGTPLQDVATAAKLHPGELEDAVATYQAAGAAALNTQGLDDSWHQVRIQFTDWESAELEAATRLAPKLRQAHDGGVIDQWWFIRKAPCWRLRWRTGNSASYQQARAIVDTLLAELREQRVIGNVWSTRYEPERYAFGGPHGVATAHRLFHADSTGFLNDLLAHLRPDQSGTASAAPIGRRELSILLCTAMLRGARQDWHEQGDVWDRVVQMRPLPAGTPTDRFGQMSGSLHTLLTADTSHHGTLMTGGRPLAFAAATARAFTAAGGALRAAADTGELQRGLRDVLAHHVLFAWNRHGLPARTQAVLARAARHTVMHPPPASPGEATHSSGPAN